MVLEKHIRIIQEMYRNVYTRVRSSVGETDGFEIRDGLHKGSALSPFIFNIVMDVMTRDVKEAVPCITEDGGNSIRLGGEEIKRVQTFKYLGSILEDSGSMDQEMRHRIQAGWHNWRPASEVLCDKVPLKLAMLYGTETARSRSVQGSQTNCQNELLLRLPIDVLPCHACGLCEMVLRGVFLINNGLAAFTLEMDLTSVLVLSMKKQ
ncbi:uncharacterized protein LOC135204394 [Macrobrachium nipponense]|uniref:uncharacterized protein LOC135204394 n=1 Tax=Macrobrachium nipponense TaxID=159736 RepID=UPI0030C8128D